MTREMNKEKNEGKKTNSAVSLQSGALGFKIFSLAFASLKSFKIMIYY
jgi:hypothetical protein